MALTWARTKLIPWVLFWGFIPCFGMFILEVRDFKDDHKEAMRQRKTRHKGRPKQGRIISIIECVLANLKGIPEVLFLVGLTFHHLATKE